MEVQESCRYMVSKQHISLQNLEETYKTTPFKQFEHQFRKKNYKQYYSTLYTHMRIGYRTYGNLI